MAWLLLYPDRGSIRRHTMHSFQSAEEIASSMSDDQQQSSGAGQGSGSPQRRYNASRLVPRVEFGRQEPGAVQPQPPSPPQPPAELVDVGGGDPFGQEPFGPGSEQYSGTPSTQTPFGGREFAGGRVRVYGCSPGCLIASLIVSLLLTLFLNALF